MAITFMSRISFILSCIYVEIYLGVGCIFMIVDMAIIEMYFEFPL